MSNCTSKAAADGGGISKWILAVDEIHVWHKKWWGGHRPLLPSCSLQILVSIKACPTGASNYAWQIEQRVINHTAFNDCESEYFKIESHPTFQEVFKKLLILLVISATKEEVKPVWKNFLS